MIFYCIVFYFSLCFLSLLFFFLVNIVKALPVSSIFFGKTHDYFQCYVILLPDPPALQLARPGPRSYRAASGWAGGDSGPGSAVRVGRGRGRRGRGPGGWRGHLGGGPAAGTRVGRRQAVFMAVVGVPEKVWTCT